MANLYEKLFPKEHKPDSAIINEFSEHPEKPPIVHLMKRIIKLLKLGYEIKAYNEYRNGLYETLLFFSGNKKKFFFKQALPIIGTVEGKTKEEVLRQKIEEVISGIDEKQ